jgi:hypothetical protein
MQPAAPGHEEARRVGIDHGNHGGLQVVQQAGELVEVRQCPDRDLAIEGNARLDRLEDAPPRTGEDRQAVRIDREIAVDVLLDVRDVGLERVVLRAARPEGLLDFPEAVPEHDQAGAHIGGLARRVRAHVQVGAYDRQIAGLQFGKSAH